MEERINTTDGAQDTGEEVSDEDRDEQRMHAADAGGSATMSRRVELTYEDFKDRYSAMDWTPDETEQR